MYMNADIEVNINRANVVPDESIVRFENKHYIFKAKNKNTFEMIEVKTGNNENGLTEIEIDEAHKNSDFVVQGAYNLLMQLKNSDEEE